MSTKYYVSVYRGGGRTTSLNDMFYIYEKIKSPSVFNNAIDLLVV